MQKCWMIVYSFMRRGGCPLVCEMENPNLTFSTLVDESSVWHTGTAWAPMALLPPYGCVKSMNPDLPLPARRERCDTGAFAVCISASAPASRADCSLFDTIVQPQAAHGWKTALNQPPEHKLCAALYLCMPVMFWHCDHQWFESCSLMYSVLNTANRVAVKEGLRAIEAYWQRKSFCQSSLFQCLFSGWSHGTHI